MKLDVTEAQLRAMIDLRDTVSSMIGCSDDFDKEQNHNVMLFDRMLNKNGMKSNNK